MNFKCSLPVGLIALAVVAAAAPATEPLPNAHAHNDYEHPRPLQDALDHGFGSVEADIYLVDGELLVAHDREDCKPERTLRALYLQPLSERVAKHHGAVFPDGPGFTLLVDIKSDGEATYAALSRLLAEYRPMLTRVDKGKHVTGPVTVIVSGNRPIETMTQQESRLAGIDGRVSDLPSKTPSHLMPLISDHWPSHFEWAGQGEFPPAQRAKLARIVAQTHQQGRRLRFWATPEDEAVWGELNAAGVDLIGTDELGRLQAFLTGDKPAAAKP